MTPFLFSAFAFLAMGSWAVFANHAHLMPAPLYAGLVQGTISACLTLFLKSVIDWLSKRFNNSTRFWAPPLIRAAPQAWKTLLPPIHTERTSRLSARCTVC